MAWSGLSSHVAFFAGADVMNDLIDSWSTREDVRDAAAAGDGDSSGSSGSDAQAAGQGQGHGQADHFGWVEKLSPRQVLRLAQEAVTLARLPPEQLAQQLRKHSDNVRKLVKVSAATMLSVSC
jgi:hypothetical protein